MVGITLKGFFRRTHEASSHAEIERVKRDLGQGSKELKLFEEYFKNCNFEVVVLDYDPSSGLLIARGHDDLGESGLVGELENDSRLKFLKYYVGRDPSHTENAIPFRLPISEYAGFIEKGDGGLIRAEGNFYGHILNIPSSDELGGIWELDQVKT